MDRYQDRTKRYYNTQGPEAIDVDVLEVIPFEGKKQEIEYQTREFSAVCPFSGLPDLADVLVRYIPDQKIVELKSLKYYFVSFRNVGMYQEEITDRIYRDLEALLTPSFLEVKTVYATRGGIDATCVVRSDKQ